MALQLNYVSSFAAIAQQECAPSLASSDKTNESVRARQGGAHKVSEWHCVKKDEKSCELHSVESTDLAQRLIHGEFPTDLCKVAIGAFVLATVLVAGAQDQAGTQNSLRKRPWPMS